MANLPPHSRRSDNVPLVDLTEDEQFEKQKIWSQINREIGNSATNVKQINEGKFSKMAWIDSIILVCDLIHSNSSSSSSSSSSSTFSSPSRSLVRCEFSDVSGNLTGNVEFCCLSGSQGFSVGDAIKFVNLPLLTVNEIPTILITQKTIEKVLHIKKTDTRQIDEERQNSGILPTTNSAHNNNDNNNHQAGIRQLSMPPSSSTDAQGLEEIDSILNMGNNC